MQPTMTPRIAVGTLESHLRARMNAAEAARYAIGMNVSFTSALPFS